MAEDAPFPARSFWIPQDDRIDIYETEFLHLDPFDPRRLYALVREAMSRWLIEEIDSRGVADASLDVEPEVVSGEALGASYAIELSVGTVRIGVAVVGRTETAFVDDHYRTPARWRIERSVSAILPLLVMEEEDGAINVFLHGWARPGELIQEDSDEASREGNCDELDISNLNPVDTLFEHLQHAAEGQKSGPSRVAAEAAVPASPVVLDSVAPPSPVVAHSVAAPSHAPPDHRIRVYAGILAITAAGLLILLFFALQGERDHFETNSFALLTGAPVRGSGQPSVRSGQSFRAEFEFQTDLQYGWMFLIDRSAGMRATAGKAKNGTLHLSFSDEFNRTTGVEYFVAILSDQNLDVLGEVNAASWLNQATLSELQSLDPASRNARAEQLLTAALRSKVGESPIVRIMVRSADHNE